MEKAQFPCHGGRPSEGSAAKEADAGADEIASASRLPAGTSSGHQAPPPQPMGHVTKPLSSFPAVQNRTQA